MVESKLESSFYMVEEAIYQPDQFIEMNNEAMIDEYKKTIVTDGIEFDKIQDYLSAQHELEEAGILKVVGVDPHGLMTYMIFGSNYPAHESDALRRNIKYMMEFIHSR